MYHIEHDHLYNFDSVKTNELSANALTEIIQHKSERPQEYEPPKNTAKQKKFAIMQKHLSSPDMAWEYNPVSYTHLMPKALQATDIASVSAIL